MHVIQYKGFGKETCKILAECLGWGVVRWGEPHGPCISWGGRVGYNALLNNANKMPANKGEARWMMQYADVPVPTLIGGSDLAWSPHAGSFPVVVRPNKHTQGRKLFVCHTLGETLAALADITQTTSDGWYVSELVEKSAEYRVHVVGPRVLFVQDKEYDPAVGVAGNQHLNGNKWRWLKWDELKETPCMYNIMKAGIDACKACHIDFGAVDVMVDKVGGVYVCEVNTAPAVSEAGAKKYGKAIRKLLAGEVKEAGETVSSLIWKGVLV